MIWSKAKNMSFLSVIFFFRVLESSIFTEFYRKMDFILL